MKNLSSFGLRFLDSSITQDLVSSAKEMDNSTKESIIPMGLGNPAFIPKVYNLFQNRMKEIVENDELFQSVFCKYSTNQGESFFLETFANFLNQTLGWNITEKNIAITSGSQIAYFFLFNLFSGISPKGVKKILLPIVPEYCGYADLAGKEDLFIANKPEIELHGTHFFKYKMKIPDYPLPDSVHTICLSRPTNPSGNIISDDDFKLLSDFAKVNKCFLIVDNAYGYPFPNITFKPIRMVFEEHIIHTFSLSKLGLPGAKTGIIVADETVIKKIRTLNMVSQLTVNNIGQFILLPFLQNGKIKNICDQIIRPFYEEKLKKTLELISFYWKDLSYRLHICEGSFFIWAWFPGLPVSDKELQKKLLQERVSVMPGSYFFLPLTNDDKWAHRHECIRINYALDDQLLEIGIKNIAIGLKKIR